MEMIRARGKPRTLRLALLAVLLASAVPIEIALAAPPPDDGGTAMLIQVQNQEFILEEAMSSPAVSMANIVGVDQLKIAPLAAIGGGSSGSKIFVAKFVGITGALIAQVVPTPIHGYWQLE